jgi:glycogen debranching enzyme
MTEEELRATVRRLMLDNEKHGYSGLLGQSYCYVAPALKPYPFQWFWDTCFHVVILARLGECDVAKRSFRSLFAMQEEDGFVGHMIFWKQLLPQRRSDVIQARPTWQALRPHMSALVQPPLAAVALHTLYEACGDRVYLGEMYARVKRHHDWLAHNRDFDDDGLLSIISPFESGMDWKASYDPVLGYRERVTPQRLYTAGLYWKGVTIDLGNFVRRYDMERIRRRARFIVKDVGFNSVYAWDLECMERLAPIAGDDPAIYAERRRRVLQSMLELMYDEDDAAFYDVREPGSEKIRIRTPTIFFPCAVPELDERIATRVIETHFDRPNGFAAPLPIPSLELRDAAFFAGETPFLWRGPTWAFTNWFLYHALRKRGFEERATRLRRSLWKLVEKSGFREYYDPLTGEGHGAREFTWSGLLIDML